MFADCSSLFVRTFFKVDEIARICAAKGVGHVINNAYGVQCSRTCRLINR